MKEIGKALPYVAFWAFLAVYFMTLAGVFGGGCA